MSEDRTKLEAIARDAKLKIQSIEAVRDEEVRAASSAIRDKFTDALREARQAHADAEQAVREHIDAAASHPWEGKRVYRIARITSRWDHHISETRVEGVLEVRRIGTVLPGNVGWGLPKLGEPFVRKLKKDGTTGAAIETRVDIGEWKLVEGGDA